MSLKNKVVLFAAIFGALFQGFIGMLFIGPVLWAIPTEPTFIRVLVTVFNGAIYVMLFWIITGAIIGAVDGMMTKTVSFSTFWRILWPVSFSVCFTIFGAVNLGLIGAVGGAIGGAFFGALTKVLIGSTRRLD